MSMRVKPDQWEPCAGISLDNVGWQVVRSENNVLVVAGPGAGKTELLAQRASFLLQTGKCRGTRRVLAISFKKDAAANLAERVKRRCGPELGLRLDSLTYDAFAKGLVDRFSEAIPSAYRPPAGYRIAFARDAEAAIADVLNVMANTRGARSRIFRKIFLQHGLVSLPLERQDKNPEMRAVCLLWERLMHAVPANLTFPMVTRLASLALLSTPVVRRALHATYSHVFLDEFQDTTEAQYDLVRAAFEGSKCTITAVGDNKQKIMTFAGAMDNAFERYETDFSAERVALVVNFRSAPRLVDIQQVLANQIDPCAAIVSSGKPDSDGQCEIWEFETAEDEAEEVARRVASWVQQEGVQPRAICILVKQRVSLYVSMIIEALQHSNVTARDETLYQDLMVEPITLDVLAYIGLLANESAPDEWSRLAGLLMDLRGYHADTPSHKIRALDLALGRFLAAQRMLLQSIRKDDNDGEGRLGRIIDALFGRMLGEEPYKQAYPQYLQGEWFDETKGRVTRTLWSIYTETDDWPKAVKQFLGTGIIPVMTAHKSKGLEYDTVVFVGLEDDAFWSYSEQQADDDCAFFVALSRAIRRVYFTFSSRRATGFHGADKLQSYRNIRLLRDVLEQAAVPVVKHVGHRVAIVAGATGG